MTVRYRKRVRADDLNSDRIFELLNGEPAMTVDPFYAGYGKKEFDLDAMRRDWDGHRDFLLGFWISGEFAWEIGNLWDGTRGYVGTRPWAWWQFDAPEADREESVKSWAYFPEGKWCHPFNDARISRDLKSEREYLTARDLLLPGEAEAIEAEKAA